MINRFGFVPFDQDAKRKSNLFRNKLTALARELEAHVRRPAGASDDSIWVAGEAEMDRALDQAVVHLEDAAHWISKAIRYEQEAYRMPAPSPAGAGEGVEG